MKSLYILGLIALGTFIIITTSVVLYEEPEEQRTYPHGHNFPDDPNGMLQIWCLDNNGIWDGEDSFCGFETLEQSMKANANLEDIKDGPDNLPEKYNQAICDLMEIQCPLYFEFNIGYNMDLGRTSASSSINQTDYIFYFDEKNPNDLTYRICDADDSSNYSGECQWQHHYLDDVDGYVVEESYNYFPMIFVAIGVVIFSLYILKKRQ